MCKKITEECPLCHSEGSVFAVIRGQTYWKCRRCSGIFREKQSLPTDEYEVIRYRQHNNNVDDVNYQNFTSPIWKAVLKDFGKKHQGLDFGAGTGPVISKMLKDNGYDIVQYDPFFANYPKLLNATYDYIVCCEVAEHFHNPDKEFLLLKKILKTQGKLYLMTSIYNDDINFEKWYYKDDDTHVFFYTRDTFEYIKNKFGFRGLKMIQNLIVLNN